MQEILFVFLIGFFGYPLIEVLWRGYSHPTMAFAGGICFLIIYYFAAAFPRLGIFKKAFFLSLAITAAELLFGIVFNLVLKLEVWNYSNSPFNLLGQICPLYSALWFLLSLVLIPVCKAVHGYLFV